MALASFGVGFVAGFGTGFLSREVFPFAREILNPISRVTMKATVKVLEKSREGLSRMGEAVEDIFAEVKQELKKEKQRKKKVRVRPAVRPAVVSGVERTA